jgi:hypothetical protein
MWRGVLLSWQEACERSVNMVEQFYESASSLIVVGFVGDENIFIMLLTVVGGYGILGYAPNETRFSFVRKHLEKGHRSLKTK